MPVNKSTYLVVHSWADGIRDRIHFGIELMV